LSLWLSDLGADLHGIALKPDSTPALFEIGALRDKMSSNICDIRDVEALAEKVAGIDPEICIHLAAQSLVRESYVDPIRTFATNVQGTTNLLDALRAAPSAKAIVCITTDKVYKDKESESPYCETDELGGYDPYSASKAAAEIAAECFRQSFFQEKGVGIATVRAGNVIGGGDWAKDRLIPDAVRAWGADEALSVRRPAAVRPWQHVLEPISGYIALAAQLFQDPSIAGAYNIGPTVKTEATVRFVVEKALVAWSNLPPDESHEKWIQWATSVEGPREATHLSLDPTKAADVLGIRPVWNVEQAITKTVQWYRKLNSGYSAETLCRNDISDFTTTARSGERNRPD
jgi:CDP-glucose 4,6-dehydratase